MNIKHGDIITLDNGDTVKVSLKVLRKKVTELIPNKRYKLKYTDSICHYYTSSGYKDYKEIKNDVFIYIGKIDVHNYDNPGRHIFYGHGYAMFSDKNLDFVVEEID